MLKVQWLLLNNDFLSSGSTRFHIEEASLQFFWSSVCFGQDDLTGKLEQFSAGRNRVAGSERQRQCGSSCSLGFSKPHVVCRSIWNEIEFFFLMCFCN